MNVHSTSSHRPAPTVQQNRPVRSEERAGAASSARPARPVRVENAEPKSHSVEKAAPRGVLRLLEEGHFKGVADVRLRINFFDAIAQKEQVHQAAGVQDTVSTFLDELATRVDTLAASTDLSSDQQAALGDLTEAFKATTHEAASAFDASEPSALEALTQEIQAAFDTFYTSVQGALEPGGSEASSEEGPAADTEAVPTEGANGLSDFLNQLTDLFTQSVDALVALGTASVLPPLSAPSGNGPAYDKFVAQYNALRPEQSVSSMDLLA